MKLLTFIFLALFSLANASELVISTLPGETITRPWYTLNYNEDHEVANWVAYTLELSQLKNCVTRSNSFRADPEVSTGSAVLTDYQGTGYDRGHLLPAGDMKFERQAMRDTFYLSNITPQPSFFNRGRWGQLELLVRAWARKYGKLWIVTGPILHNSLSWVGKENQVSIPEEYFKVLLRKDKSGYKGIAFLMRTDVPYPELKAYSIDINKVEDLSKNDFFPFLNSQEERQAEARFDLSDWDFTARFEYLACETSAAQ